MNVWKPAMQMGWKFVFLITLRSYLVLKLTVIELTSVCLSSRPRQLGGTEKGRTHQIRRFFPGYSHCIHGSLCHSSDAGADAHSHWTLECWCPLVPPDDCQGSEGPRRCQSLGPQCKHKIARGARSPTKIFYSSSLGAMDDVEGEYM